MRAREDIRMLNEISLASKRSHDEAMRRQVNVQKELDDVQQAIGAAESRRDRLKKEISRYVSERTPSGIVW
jgi:predicted  nucleic acid-binding Zn-ribbon protein